MLTVFIEEVTRESGISPGELDAIAVSMGPGSYTGLRIGVAAAKGLCYALDKPLVAIPTLQAMAAGMNDELKIKNFELFSEIPCLVCPMIDARRMEVYCAVYDGKNREVEPVRPEIIDENSFGNLLARNRIVFGGEGAAKCKPDLETHPNALFIDGFASSARHMHTMAATKLSQSHFENLAYFEPFYLKDFVAGKPRIKGLI